MASGILDKDLIPQSHLWSMALGIEPRAIDVILFPPVPSEPVIHRSIAIDPTTSVCKSVEDAVYCNPLLLSDFNNIVCSLPTDPFMILPPDVAADSRLCRRAFTLAHPDSDSSELTVINTPAENASVVSAADSMLTGFLRRSFYNVRFTHPFVELTAQACSLSTNNMPAMLVRLAGDFADVVAAKDKRLLMANRYRITAPIDAAYYVLASRKSLGISAEAPLRLAGPVESRRSLGDILRPYLSDVADLALSPRLWQAGTPALTAPLHLLLLHPSCA